MPPAPFQEVCCRGHQNERGTSPYSMGLQNMGETSPLIMDCPGCELFGSTDSRPESLCLPGLPSYNHKKEVQLKNNAKFYEESTNRRSTMPILVTGIILCFPSAEAVKPRRRRLGNPPECLILLNKVFTRETQSIA